MNVKNYSMAQHSTTQNNTRPHPVLYKTKKQITTRYNNSDTAQQHKTAPQNTPTYSNAPQPSTTQHHTTQRDATNHVVSLSGLWCNMLHIYHISTGFIQPKLTALCLEI